MPTPREPSNRLWTACLIGLAALPLQPATAQDDRGPDAFVNQQRAARDRIWEQIDREMPAEQKIDFDYGGSYSFNLFLYDDGVNSSRTLRRHDVRLWTRLTFDQGAHEVYARAHFSHLDFNTGDSFDGKDNDTQEPNLERGYYRFDLQRALRAYAQRHVNYNLRVKIGRDLVEMGTGLTLSQTLDHLSLEATCCDIEVTGLVGRSVGSSFDFDETRPTDRTRRAFFAAQFRYLGWERHRPFAYVLWQRDHNREVWATPLREFDYDSVYFALGSRGELTDDLTYSAEWVFERGHSHGQRRLAGQDTIRAWAFDFELEYLFDLDTHPRASIEYMFASGDSDRRGSPSDTMGGNRGDSTDSGFNAFGYRDTGLSFAPRLSNTHVWRAGASFFPFEGDTRLDRLELGTNWFLYWKNHRAGAVSDPTADVRSGHLGWEMDYYANWAVTNDLAWTVRYGVFFPGSAYSDRTTRTFLVTGVTWSF